MSELRDVATKTQTWGLRSFPRIDPMGDTMLRVLDVTGRQQLLVEHDFVRRLHSAVPRRPGAELTTAEALRWLGLAFMMGAVFGAFVVMLASGRPL